MLRSAASKVMWMGRATVFLVGLAVILALLLGVASMALGANGKPFLLGKRNVASTVSTLVKQGPGPALRLLVRSGQPPMAVNSQVKVSNLNADKLDGQDSSAFLPVGAKAADSDKLDGRDSAGFLSSEVYGVTEVSLNTPANVVEGRRVRCDEGDLSISGGFLFVEPTSHVRSSARFGENAWFVQLQTGSTPDTYDIHVVCADLPPLRP